MDRNEAFDRIRSAVGTGNVCDSCKGIHPQQRKALNRAQVLFRGRRLTIKTAHCNRPGNPAQALSGVT